jgi:hypothetical protein
MADPRDVARARAEARATLERLRHLAPPRDPHAEDSLEAWRRSMPQPEPPKRDPVAAVIDRRLGAERQRQTNVLAEMQGELAEALSGIADALGTLDQRLQKLEAHTKNKTTAARRPVDLPNFLERDPTLRYAERIQ